MPGRPLIGQIFEQSLDFCSLDDMQEALGLDAEADHVVPRMPPTSRRSLSNGPNSDPEDRVSFEEECCCEYDENPRRIRTRSRGTMGEEDNAEYLQDKGEKIVAAEAVVAAINKALCRQDISSVQRGQTLPYFDAEDQLHQDGRVRRGFYGQEERAMIEGVGLASGQPTQAALPYHLGVEHPNEEGRSRSPRISRNPSYICAVDSVDADACSDSPCSTASSSGSRRITPVRVIKPDVHRSGSGRSSEGDMNRRSLSPQAAAATQAEATADAEAAQQHLINKEGAYVRRSVSGCELKSLTSVGGGAGVQFKAAGSSCETLHVYGGGYGTAGASTKNSGNSSQQSSHGGYSVPLGTGGTEGTQGASAAAEESGNNNVVRSASFTVISGNSSGVGPQVHGDAEGGTEQPRRSHQYLGSFSAGHSRDTSRSHSRSPSPTQLHPSTSSVWNSASSQQSPKFSRGTSLSNSFRKILRIKSVPGLKTPRSSGPPTPTSPVGDDDVWLDSPGSPDVNQLGAKTHTSGLKRVGSNISKRFSKGSMSGSAPKPTNVTRSLSNGQMLLAHTADSNGPSSVQGVNLVEYEALMKLFTCPGCQILMTPPLYQCRKGHIVCATCKQTSKQACPTCKQRFQDNTNMMMEQVCNLLKFPCRYCTEGCPQMYTPRARIDHEHFCEYRPVHCHNANKGCKAVMILKDMNKHLKDCSFK